LSLKSSITGNTKVLCVIGHPIAHSMSPIMHNAVIQDLKLDFVYVAFDILPEHLEKAVEGFKALGIKGINVTIPHKIAIMKLLDEIDPLAEKIGAINTIKNENNHLIGKNTDALGAKVALLNAGFDIMEKNVLIIGAGGAARAIAFSLSKECKKIVILNRTEQKAFSLARDLKKIATIPIEGKKLNEQHLKQYLFHSDLLINTTSVGMAPNTNTILIPKEWLSSHLFVFDVIYNPLETKLIKDAKEIGCKTLGGLDMLVNQGALAFEWWTGEKPNKILMKNKIIEFLNLKQC